MKMLLFWFLEIQEENECRERTIHSDYYQL